MKNNAIKELSKTVNSEYYDNIKRISLCENARALCESDTMKKIWEDKAESLRSKKTMRFMVTAC